MIFFLWGGGSGERAGRGRGGVGWGRGARLSDFFTPNLKKNVEGVGRGRGWGV